MAKRLILAFVVLLSAAAFGQNCARRDDYLSTAMGQAIAGANVYYYLQPGGVGSPANSTVASTYSDNQCSVPQNYAVTNGFGQAASYMAPAVYTIVFQSPYIQTKTLPDQSIGTGGSGTVTSVTCDNLDPLFTCQFQNQYTTPVAVFTQENAAAYTVFGNAGANPAYPAFTNLVTQMAGANVQGNGSLFQLSTGTITPGDCAQYDAFGNTTDAGAPCGAGSISGLIAGAVVTGKTSTSIQTPDGLATLDSAGNFNTDGQVGTGLGATTAGWFGCAAGTAQTTLSGYAGFTCPTSVTAYNIVLPSAAASGVMTVANSSNIMTMTIEPNYRVCSIVVGSDDAATALVNSNLGPQGKLCKVPRGSTLVEVDVAADGGTPNVIVGRYRPSGTSSANLVSAALATAASGGDACSNVGGTTGIDGVTTCSATLQNTSLNAGDWLQLVSGTAGGTAKRMSISLVYTIN